MAEDNTVRTSYERVRLYAELHAGFSLGGEIVYDQRFRTEAWPRTAYALEKGELIEVLDELVELREEVVRLKGEVGDLEHRIMWMDER